MFAKIEGIKVSAVAGCISKNQKSLSEYTSGLLDESDIKRFNKKTGFLKLSITDENTTAFDLCCRAAENLLQNCNLRKEEIDAVIFVTTSPDYQLPNNSSIIQYKLGLSNKVIAFDINQGCPGFVQGIYTASCLIASGGVNKVLLCVGDTRSKNTNPMDRATRPLFGDAGSATLIERGNNILYFTAETYGEYFGKIIIRNGGARNKKVSKNENNYTDNYISMDGWGMTNFVLEHAVPSLENLLETYSLNIEDLEMILIHQANKVFSKTIAEQLGLEYDKVPFFATNYGNTGATSIPLALSGLTDMKLGSFSKMCLCSFGCGLSIAIAITDLNDTQFIGIDEI